MLIIYRSIFSVAFSAKSDRDTFQADLNQRVDKLVSDGGYKSRVVPQAGTPQMGNQWDLTSASEIGFQYFDAQANAVWSARVIVGFSDPAERDAFHNALQGTYKAGNLAFDSMGKSKTLGIFQTDILPVREDADTVSVSF